MSDGLDDLLNDATDPASPGQGGALRKQLEQVLAQNKALNDRLAAQDAAARQRDLDGLFAKHQVPGLAKDLFPKDAEPTDEAVTALVERYGSLWGQTSASATTDPQAQAAATAAQQFAANAGPAPATPLTEDQFRAKFAEAKNPAELHQMLAQLQASGG